MGEYINTTLGEPYLSTKPGPNKGGQDGEEEGGHEDGLHRFQGELSHVQANENSPLNVRRMREPINPLL